MLYYEKNGTSHSAFPYEKASSVESDLVLGKVGHWAYLGPAIFKTSTQELSIPALLNLLDDEEQYFILYAYAKDDTFTTCHKATAEQLREFIPEIMERCEPRGLLYICPGDFEWCAFKDRFKPIGMMEKV